MSCADKLINFVIVSIRDNICNWGVDCDECFFGNMMRTDSFLGSQEERDKSIYSKTRRITWHTSSFLFQERRERREEHRHVFEGHIQVIERLTSGWLLLHLLTTSCFIIRHLHRHASHLPPFPSSFIPVSHSFHSRLSCYILSHLFSFPADTCFEWKTHNYDIRRKNEQVMLTRTFLLTRNRNYNWIDR